LKKGQFTSSPGPSNCGGAGAVGRRAVDDDDEEVVLARLGAARACGGPLTASCAPASVDGVYIISSSQNQR
jgi:hypothetical protein